MGESFLPCSLFAVLLLYVYASHLVLSHIPLSPHFEPLHPYSYLILVIIHLLSLSEYSRGLVWFRFRYSLPYHIDLPFPPVSPEQAQLRQLRHQRLQVVRKLLVPSPVPYKTNITSLPLLLLHNTPSTSPSLMP